MAISEQYRRQVSLLMQVLPHVAEESCFALKGGTAINLFVRDLPRLSVDIDLTYLPVADRPTSLAEISAAMSRISERVSGKIPGTKVHKTTLGDTGTIYKLVVQTPQAQVKIEVTPVLRGCVYEPEPRFAPARVEAEFGSAEISVVSFADLYAGKIVAALDRQHPRDLFDVRDLLENEGIDDALRTAFIVYLISHGRPFAEILDPTRRDISHEFEHGFIGMTETPVTQKELEEAREQLISDIVGKMPVRHRDFLISFKEKTPDWALLDIAGVEDLPAVKWRMQNLARLDEDRRKKLLENLKQVFGRA